MFRPSWALRLDGCALKTHRLGSIEGGVEKRLVDSYPRARLELLGSSSLCGLLEKHRMDVRHDTAGRDGRM